MTRVTITTDSGEQVSISIKDKDDDKSILARLAKDIRCSGQSAEMEGQGASG